MQPPANYRLLPDGVRCRCINLWQDRQGRFYCCGATDAEAPAPSEDPISLGDVLNQVIPQMTTAEQQARLAEFMRLAVKVEELRAIGFEVEIHCDVRKVY